MCISMIVNFKDQGTDDIFHGRPTKKARGLLSKELWGRAHDVLTTLDASRSVSHVACVPAYRFELLSGDLKGWCSLRINGQYRVVFKFDEKSGNAHDVYIVDYHP